MGLQDREWFHEERRKREARQKQQSTPKHRPKRTTQWEPSWGLVIVLLCAAAAATYWL